MPRRMAITSPIPSPSASPVPENKPNTQTPVIGRPTRGTRRTGGSISTPAPAPQPKTPNIDIGKAETKTPIAPKKRVSKRRAANSESEDEALDSSPTQGKSKRPKNDLEQNVLHKGKIPTDTAYVLIDNSKKSGTVAKSQKTKDVKDYHAKSAGRKKTVTLANTEVGDQAISALEDTEEMPAPLEHDDDENQDDGFSGFDPSLADPFLEDTYSGLARLPTDTEMSVRKNGEKRIPYIKISNFVDPAKQPYMEHVKELITFSSSNKFNVVNLAREHPGFLVTRNPNPAFDTKYIGFNNRRDAALCIMVAFCHEDATREMREFKMGEQTKYSKKLTIYPLSMEMERQVAAISYLISAEVFKGYGFDNRLDISTQATNRTTASSAPFAKRVRLSGATASKKPLGAPVLFATDDVPIIDARTDQFRLPEDVANLDKFDSYTEQIPCGTLVLVGFLTSTFQVKVNKESGDSSNSKGKEKAKGKEKTIPAVAHNLQFVAVLGNDEL